jgi:DNA-binding transcriptional ArsR family regulator
MHPKRTDNGMRSGPELNRPLPMQLAKALKPETRQALMHGVRRRILRMLNQDPIPRTARDLLKTFPDLSLSSLNYHILVLDECGILTVSRAKATQGSFARVFTANVADDAQLLAALQATESLDDAR